MGSQAGSLNYSYQMKFSLRKLSQDNRKSEEAFNFRGLPPKALNLYDKDEAITLRKSPNNYLTSYNAQNILGNIDKV